MAADAAEKDALLSGLLNVKIRELQAQREVEQAALDHCKVRVRDLDKALAAALSNARMCGVTVDERPTYRRDAEPFSEAEIAKMICGEASDHAR